MTFGAETSAFCSTCGAQLTAGARFCQQCGTEMTSKKQTDISVEEQAFNADKDKLFRVYSVVNNFRYKDIFYDNLIINWFAVGREVPPVPFEEEIENYLQLSTVERIHPENFLKEHFTLKEAESLKHYLGTIESIDAFIKPCPLPVSANEKGYRDFPPPIGVGFVIMHNRKHYNLPFKVEGIFNTNRADQRVEGDDDRATIVSGINVKEIRERLKKKES